MRKPFVISCLLLFVSYWSCGQKAEWHLLFSMQVENLDQISMDNRDNVFYSDLEGNVYKIDGKGTVSGSYSPSLQAKLEQLEAFSTLTLFLFSADLQQAVLLDNFLRPLSVHAFQQENIGIVKAATLGNNYVFWLFDETDMSLKKFDYQRNTVVQKQPLSLVLGDERIEVVEIQERQNMVFLNIKNQGIFIFDNQGNLIKRLNALFEQPMSFYNDHLYYIKEEAVHQLNIYSGEEIVYNKPEASAQHIIVGHHKIILYSRHSLQVYGHPEFDF